MQEVELGGPRELHLSKNHIDSVDVSSSGKRIIIGWSALEGNTWDGGLTLLSNDGKEICSRYSPAGISMARFSGPKIILAGRDDGNVAIYSANNLEEMQKFGVHDDFVSCVADDPHHESQFASCGWDGSIHLWDWQSKSKPVTSYHNAHQGHVNEVVYSHLDPNLFSTVGWDGFLREWDRRESPSVGCSSIVNIGQISSCVSYERSRNGMLLIGSDAGDIVQIDMRGGSNSLIVHSSRIHSGRIRRIAACPSTSSGLFAIASDDTTYTICESSVHGIIQRR